MKTRLALSLVTLAALAVLLGAASRDARPEEAGLCRALTPARMLEDPQIAGEYYGAMHRGDPAAQARFHDLVSQIREVHGCGALDDGAAELPASAPGVPRLPPGHPPIPSFERAPRAPPMFSGDPRVLAI